MVFDFISGKTCMGTQPRTSCLSDRLSQRRTAGKAAGKSENDPGRPSPHLYENRKEPGADREAAEANAGEMRMEQKVIYNGQILTLTRFWATGEPCLWITDHSRSRCPKWSLWEPPGRILHFPEKSDGNRTGTDHISGRRSTGCERRTKRHRMRRTL